jgi:hypothetical protein
MRWLIFIIHFIDTIQPYLPEEDSACKCSHKTKYFQIKLISFAVKQIINDLYMRVENYKKSLQYGGIQQDSTPRIVDV